MLSSHFLFNFVFLFLWQGRKEEAGVLFSQDNFVHR